MSDEPAPVCPPRRPRRLRQAATVLLTLAAGASAAALAAFTVVWTGGYNLAANVPHTQPVHALLEAVLQRLVRQRAAHIDPPPLTSPALQALGAACYRDKCVQCHGGPGVAQAEIGRSMQPLPGPLVDAAQRWAPQELYWITRNGIKMTGMPAWQYRLDEQRLWALVAFMQRLPLMTAADFQQGLQQPDADCTAAAPEPVHEPDAERGRIAFTQYACTACHRIPGVPGSDVHVGPPLAGLAGRALIAGALPNTADNLVRWIREPRSIDAQTTMPDMEVGEADARDMAAYLATLR